jgi:hypothetical protein
MNTLEDRLTAALRETAEEITGDSVPPLRLTSAPRRLGLPRGYGPEPLANPADAGGRRRGGTGPSPPAPGGLRPKSATTRPRRGSSR